MENLLKTLEDCNKNENNYQKENLQKINPLSVKQHEKLLFDLSQIISNTMNNSNVDDIVNFINECTRIAQWTCETEIVALILLLRWIFKTKKSISLDIWKQTIFISLLVSQKEFDDIPIRNDFMLDLWNLLNPENTLTIKQIDKMEYNFLIDLEFEVNVSVGLFSQIINYFSD